MDPFEALGLEADILQALNDLGFTQPTDVQEKAIPKALSSESDLCVLAQTGTGKTAAFGLPLIELIDNKKKHTQGLILAPTRELCVQISRDLAAFSKYRKGLVVTSVYGGASIRTQITAIRKGTQIIVATPGRLIDLIERGAVKLDSVSNVVLDEADEMLNMGFQEALTTILKETPPAKRTWLFSATMSSGVKRIAKGYMNEWEEVVIGRQNSASSQIDHQYCVVHGKDKHHALRRFIDVDPSLFAIVFCRTKLGAQRTAERLIKEGYDADSLHGDLSQDQRDKVMGRYRQRSLKILVATDVAARGIDVNEVTHVFHYDLPNDIESYTHRSGRTGRAGNKGISMSILGKGDVRKISRFQNDLKTDFTQVQVPNGADICEKQLLALIARIKDVKVNTKEIARFMPLIQEQLGTMDPEQVLERVMAIEFNRFLSEYKNARDLNVSVDQKRSKTRMELDDSDLNMRGMFINLGRHDDMDPGRMLAHLCNTSGLDGDVFGRIKLRDSFTIVDVQKDFLQEVIHSLNGTDLKGRTIEAKESEEQAGGRGGSRDRDSGRRGRGGFKGKGGGGRGRRSESFSRGPKKFRGKERTPFRKSRPGKDEGSEGEGGNKKRSFKGVGGKPKKQGSSKRSSAKAKTKGKRNKYKSFSAAGKGKKKS